jgi:predicted dienelactone hydrolase
MKGLTIILGVLVFMQLQGQSYSVGHTRDTLTDPYRENRAIPLQVYYPSDSSGLNTALTRKSTEKFPLLCFAHGYRVHPEFYANIWKAAVPEGYIVVLPETAFERFPSHLELSLIHI